MVVGRDTRRSGPMLVAALAAGFHSVGVDTFDAGVIPVGGVSALVTELGADLGVMVSASHNPAPDNGIKFLDADGFKLDDEREAEIEARLSRGAPWRCPTGAGSAPAAPYRTRRTGTWPRSLPIHPGRWRGCASPSIAPRRRLPGCSPAVLLARR